MNTSECRGCNASIIWTRTADGRNMPLDAVPNERGTFTIDVAYHPQAQAVYHAVSVVHTPEFKGKKYVPHWATCPERERFRTGKRR